MATGGTATGLYVTPAVTLVVEGRAAQQYERPCPDLRRPALQAPVHRRREPAQGLHEQFVYQGRHVGDPAGIEDNHRHLHLP